MRSKRIGMLTALLGLLAAGCGSGPAGGEVCEVRVAAAANLKYAFDEVVGEFHDRHPDVKVSVTYGSSGNFFAQLTNRAPFDLFLSADVEYPRKLVEQGQGEEGTEFVYALGQLVVWVPSRSTLDLDERGLRALADPSVGKVAIANPRHAPYGRAAEDALKGLGVLDELKGKLVLGENVEQAAHFVASGAADAGVLALSQALAPALRGKGRYAVVPPDAYPPLEQGGVILTWARDGEATCQLRDFLLGSAGREVLRRHGYAFPKE